MPAGRSYESEFSVAAASLDAQQNCYQFIDFFAGVVKRQRRANCALYAHTPKNRLRTMMTQET
jgi:hypothetical protein